MRLLVIRTCLFSIMCKACNNMSPRFRALEKICPRNKLKSAKCWNRGKLRRTNILRSLFSRAIKKQTCDFKTFEYVQYYNSFRSENDSQKPAIIYSIFLPFQLSLCPFVPEKIRVFYSPWILYTATSYFESISLALVSR